MFFPLLRDNNYPWYSSQTAACCPSSDAIGQTVWPLSQRQVLITHFLKCMAFLKTRCLFKLLSLAFKVNAASSYRSVMSSLGAAKVQSFARNKVQVSFWHSLAFIFSALTLEWKQLKASIRLLSRLWPWNTWPLTCESVPQGGKNELTGNVVAAKNQQRDELFKLQGCLIMGDLWEPRTPHYA